MNIAASYRNVVLALGVLVSVSISPGSRAETPDLKQLLEQVPEKASWQELPENLRGEFVAHAKAILAKDRAAWGKEGLLAKERALLSAPTELMKQNINRVLSVTFKAERPGGFELDRDVPSIPLKRLLIRIYLNETSARGSMLLNHPDFKSWDGTDVKDVDLLNHETMAAMAEYMEATEKQLKELAACDLTEAEKAVREKCFFVTRRNKHFHRPAVGRCGSFGWASLYKLGEPLRPFRNEVELLDAYNASMFAEFRDVNKASLRSFQWDWEQEFTADWLTSQGLSPATTASVLKLGNLYLTRVLAHPDGAKPYTLYSPEERAANWDTFTAKMIANGTGEETMESYAKRYAEVARKRSEAMRELAASTLEAVFPAGSADLTDAQRTAVLGRIKAETKPAAMLRTMYAALDESTGGKTASAKLRAVEGRQVKLGGYEDGETLRPADKEAVLKMWTEIREFLGKEYGGYRVDLKATVPDSPSAVSTTSPSSFAIGGNVSIGLQNPLPAADLCSTVMHEIKHAIDQKSGAAVEGAAWEGAATRVERQVFPKFWRQFYQAEKSDVLMSELLAAISFVRLTATTDATLKIYLRGPDQGAMDSFEYAKQIVRGYGYDDEKILELRAKRANAGTQYFEYDYGDLMYQDLIEYLQTGIGPSPQVDPYLLQACGMPSPRKDKAAIELLAERIKEKH